MSSDFVAALEDLLDLNAEPYDPQRPKVNFDETNKQLIQETRPPLPTQAGRVAKFDFEYRRNGTANLFMFVEPQAGWRHVAVTARRTKGDFAEQMRWLVEERYPDATVVRVTLDNLNTHKPGALYEAFGPEQARRILKKLEFHYTPKHGSWLNMAEIELSVLQRQCLNRRMPDRETLVEEIAAWEKQRNEQQAKIDWRFSLEDARKKMKRLYPSTST